MSIPDNPGPDDPFWQQLADLNTDAPELNVRLLSDLELTETFGDTRRALIDSGQMLNPTTEAGRELHSRRAALLIEMERRWPGKQ